ncbi:MAG TPA: HDIG domain-containing protein [Bacteroidia bacterium]|nr:HDIG domain-containing protein [Bacteroidia bacterium]
MKKFFLFLTNRHEDIFKYVIILGAILLIVAALPADTQFNYEIRKGKPWAYEPLIAPFDFAIYKTESELTQERIEMMQNAHSVFHLDTSIASRKIETFREEYEDAFPGKRKAALIKSKSGNQQVSESDLCISMLKEIYERGIIQLDESPEMQHLTTITIVRNNIAEDRNIGSLYTIRTAAEYISNELAGDLPHSNNRLLNLLENSLAHNVSYDSGRTLQLQKQALENISLTRGMVQSGESIIRKGELIDNDKYQKLQSLRVELQNMELTFANRYTVFFGHFIIVAAAIAMLIIFLAQFRKEIFAENKKIFFLMLQIVITCYMYVWLRKLNLPSHYIAPVCILPIVVRTFFDTRVALFTSIVTLLIISFLAPDGFDYMFIQTITSMTATFSIVNLRNRSQFFITAGLIFVSYVLTYYGVSVLHRGDVRSVEWENIQWLLVSSVVSLFAFPMIFLFEKLFGFLSDVSLMELADSNRKLLRELALKAPGTFQHSLQVANLAEAAVYKVGGNTLLVRAGALYHDIGKMEMPLYFIENLSTQSNPHDELPFEESAGIIISHVIKGIEIAKNRNLPEQLIDFIRTHHGTTYVQYFYQSFLKNFPDEELHEDRFHYHGPLPFSKETAVLMMADSVEAASRSLKKVDKEIIDELVETIINSQVKQDQFINCSITMRDISEIKKIFKKMLMSIYHIRIEYPER